MADEVDNKIIQMRFENGSFERNIAKSKKSIEELKEALNFEETSEGMSKFSRILNSLDFERLEDNIQKLTDRFTGLGDAGDYILRRIRASIEGLAMEAENFIKSLTVGQIGVGQSKYNALNKAVMTIVSSGKYTEETAYSVFERLMTYTNETSYSFMDMVNQISTFTAAGQDLVASEQVMEGIANLSAKAGQGVSEASAAMYTFSKAIGQGYLDLQKWQSLNSTAHITIEEFRQVLADAAVAQGTLKKEGDKYYTNTKKGKKTLVELSNLENTLNQQWATSAVLMEALQKYYFKDIDDPNADWETFAGTAAKAAQRALSLADAFNAMREAASAHWMESLRYIFGDLTEAMELFTNVANRVIEIIDKIGEARNEILRVWKAEGGRQALIDILLGDYGKDIKTGAYGLIDVIEDAGKLIYDGIVDFIGLFMDEPWRILAKEDPDVVKAWLSSKLIEITTSVRDFIQSIRDWFNELITVDGKTKSRLQLIRETIMGVAAAFKYAWDLFNGIFILISNIGAQLSPAANSILWLLGQIGLAIYDSAKDASDGNVITKFFSDLSEMFRPLTEGINELVKAFTELIDAIFGIGEDNGTSENDSIFKYLGDALKFIAKVINTVGVPIIDFIKNLVLAAKSLFTPGTADTNSSSSIFGAFGDLITGLISGFSSADFSLFQERLSAALAWLKNINLGSLVRAIIGGYGIGQFIGMLRQIKEAFKKVREFFTDPGNNLKQGVLGEYEFFSERIRNIAIALGIIAASVIMLGSMDTGKLIQGGIAMVVIMGAMYYFVNNMNEMIKNTNTKQRGVEFTIIAVAAAIVAIAAAMSVLVLALIPLASDPIKMLTALVGFVVIFGAFYLFITQIISKISIMAGILGGDRTKKMYAISSMILMLSVAVAIMAIAIGAIVLAMTPLALTGWKKILPATIAVVAIIGAIGVFFVKMTNEFRKMNQINKFGIGKIIALMFSLSISVVILAAAISAIVLAMTPLAVVGWKGILSATAAVAIIFVAIGTFITIMLEQLKFLSGDKWSGIGKIAVILLILSVSMVIIAASISSIVLAMTPLAAIGWKGALGAAAAIGVILAAIAVFFIVMIQKMNELSGGTTKGIFRIVALLMSLSIAMTILAASFVMIAAGISAIFVSIAPLAVFGWKTLLTVTGSIILLLAAIGLFFKLMLGALKNLAGGDNSSFKEIAKLGSLMLLLSTSIVILSVGVSAILVAMAPLALTGWKGILSTALAVGLVLGAIGLFVLLVVGALREIAGGSDSKFKDIAKISILMLVLSASIVILSAGISAILVAMAPLAAIGFRGIISSVAGLALVLLAISIFITTLLTAMSGVNGDTKTILKNGLVLVIISAVVTLISLAISRIIVALLPLTLLDWDAWGGAILGFGIIILAIAGFILVTKNIKMKDIISVLAAAAVAVAIGYAMKLVIESLSAFSSMNNEQFKRTMIGFGILLLGMAAVIALASLLPMNIGALISTIIALAAFVGAMYLVSIILERVKDINPTTILYFMAGISAVLLAVSVAMAISLVGGIYGAISFLIGVVALCGAMYVAALALEKIKDIDTKTIIAFFGGLSVALIAIAAAMAIANIGGIGGAIALAVGLAAIIAVIALLGPWLIGNIGGALMNLSSQLAIMADMFRLFSSRMGSVDEGAFDKAKRVINLVIDLMSRIIEIALSGASSSILLSISSQLATIADMFKLFSARMSAVKEANFEKAKRCVDMLKDALGNGSNAITASVAASLITSASSNLVTMADMFGTFSSRMDAVSEISFLKLGFIVTSLALYFGNSELINNLLGNTSSFSQIMWNIGVGMEMLDNHTKNLDIVKNNSSDSIISLIQNLAGCANDLNTIATMKIDSLISNISGLGGAMMLYAMGANEVASTETGETTNISGAVDILKAISKSLVDESGEFAIPTNMPSETEFGTFGAQLAALAGALIQFEAAGSGLGSGTENALRVLTFFKDLKEKLVESDLTGNVAYVKSTNDAFSTSGATGDALQTFGANIEALGLALKQFAISTSIVDEATGEFKPIDYSNAIATLDSLAEIQTKLPNVGGFIQAITGEKMSLSDLGNEIQLLGSNLMTFSDKVTGKEKVEGAGRAYNDADILLAKAQWEVVKAAVQTVSEFGDITATLPNIGGVMEVFVGEKLSLQELGNQIQILGSNLMTFSSLVLGDISVYSENQEEAEAFDSSKIEIAKARWEAVKGAVDTVSSLSKISGELPDTGGIRSWITGDKKTLASLGSDVQALGSGLMTFSDYVTGNNTENGTAFNSTAVNSALGSLDEIVDFSERLGSKMPRLGGLANFFKELFVGRDFSLTDLSHYVAELGTGLAALGTGLSEGNWSENTGVEYALGALNAILELMVTLQELRSAAEKNMGGTLYGAAEEFVGFLDYFVMSVESENNMTAVRSLVKLMSDINDEFNSYTDIDPARIEMFEHMAGALAKLATVDPSYDWKVVGVQIDAGIAEGLIGSQSLVTTAASQVALAAYSAAMKTLDAHSPSRLFMEVGRFIGEGLAIGIDKTAGAVGDSAEGMSQEAVDKANDVIGLISRIMAEDVNSQPTITPVLDMSNVSAGLAEFNRDLGSGGINLDVSGAVARANRAVGSGDSGSVNQNGIDLNGIYQRMNQMTEEITNLGTAISNIRLVLDTGVVAGAVTNGVDVNIGRNMFYADRRN